MENSETPEDARDWDRFVSDLHHRLKNNLQTITSLISLQASRIEDAKVARAVQTIQNRVRAVAGVFGSDSTPDLATVHFGNYLRVLIEELAAEYAISQRIEVKITTADMAVGIDQAIPLALIANELAANAFEHAFPGEGSGELRVALSYRREATDSVDALAHGVLEVNDDGIPLPSGWDSERGEATGFYLVKILTSQLRANFSVEEQTRGKLFRIRFAISA